MKDKQENDGQGKKRKDKESNDKVREGWIKKI